MTIRQERFGLLLDSANDHRNALSLLIHQIHHNALLVERGSQTAQQALNTLDLIADINQLLKSPVRSQVTLERENEHFTLTYHRNQLSASRQRLKRGTKPHRQYRTKPQEISIESLTSIPFRDKPQTLPLPTKPSSPPAPEEEQQEDVSEFLSRYFESLPDSEKEPDAS